MLSLSSTRFVKIFRENLFSNLFKCTFLAKSKKLSVTKIKQERANQDSTKIDPLFDFLLHFSMFLLEIVSTASQLNCETMFKISRKNIEKFRRKSKKGPILVLSWLVLSCWIFVTVACFVVPFSQRRGIVPNLENPFL